MAAGSSAERSRAPGDSVFPPFFPPFGPVAQLTHGCPAEFKPSMATPQSYRNGYPLMLSPPIAELPYTMIAAFLPAYSRPTLTAESSAAVAYRPRRPYLCQPRHARRSTPP